MSVIHPQESILRLFVYMSTEGLTHLLENN